VSVDTQVYFGILSRI